MEETGWFARLEKGHHWVTPQLDLFTDRGSVSYSETWPRSGTMRNGTAYRRVPSAPPTSVIASSFWPTPDTAQGRSPDPDGLEFSESGRTAYTPNGRKVQIRLSTAVKWNWLPTPSANEPMLERRAMSAKNAFHTESGSVRERRADGRTSNLGLSGTVMFPTPVSRDWKGTGFESQLGTMAARGMWPTIRATDGERGGRGDLIQAHGWSLAGAVHDAASEKPHRLWPTPVRQDAIGSRNKYCARVTHGENSEHHAGTTLTDAMIDEGELEIVEKEDGGNYVEGGQLNPDWTEWLMGLPPGWTEI